MSTPNTPAFGFEFQLPTPPASHDPNAPAPATQAIVLLQDLLAPCIDGDDDLAELVDRIHPRAARKFGDFLRFLQNHRSQVTLDFQGRTVSLENHSAVANAAARLHPSNLRAEILTVQATLIHLDLCHRSFSLNPLDTDDSLSGRVAPGFPNDPSLQPGQQLTATIRRLEVGASQPRYTLLGVSSSRSTTPR